MAPNVSRKAHEDVFLKVIPKMIFVGENLSAKLAQTLFGQVWGNSGKNTSHPQTFPFSYNYGTKTLPAQKYH